MINLLMIDDNPIEHIIMQKMLDKFHLFPAVSHSQDARLSMSLIESFYQSPESLPDVIFLDLNMPGFNGWDFLDSFDRIYKQIKKTIDIYIISSSIDPKDQLLVDKYAFVKANINKPVKLETLLNLYSLYQGARRVAS